MKIFNKYTKKIISLVTAPLLMTGMISCAFASEVNKNAVGNAIVDQAESDNTISTEKPGYGDFHFSSVRRPKGSFIQSWLAAYWDQERWDQEILEMKKSGMDFIIIQAVGGTDYDTDGVKQRNVMKLPMKSCSVDYPSKLSFFEGGYNGTDLLGNCLRACKKHGLKVMIGTISDNRLWKFGWSIIPTMPFGKIFVSRDSYMAQWAKQYGERCDAVIKEVMEMYGEEYGDQIYGWYYDPEIWNIRTACWGIDLGTYSKIIGNSLSNLARSCSKYCPGKPILVSPFINPSNSTARQCGNMWRKVFAHTAFRPGDIFCPQDSYGNNPNIDLENWYREYKRAVDTKPGLKLWANNENFRSGGIATIDSFARQIEATAKYAEANICFSWNHYYSNTQENKGYDASYRYYIKTGSFDQQAPAKPEVSVSGNDVFVKSYDNIGICGIRIYDVSGQIVRTNICADDNDLTKLGTFSDLDSGKYYAETYDFFSNASEKVEFTIN